MRIMKKRITLLFVTMCAMLMLTGCRMYANYTLNGDGTVTTKGMTAYSEEEMETLGDSKDNGTWKRLEDGKRYYVVETKTETMTLEELEKEDSIYLTEDMCVYEAGDEEESSDVDMSDMGMYLQLSVTFTSKIASTNGRLSDDGKTVIFDSEKNGKDARWYAYTEKGTALVENDHTPPKMKGAKSGKYYRYMPASLEFVDDVKVAEIRLNGKVVKSYIASYVVKSNKRQQYSIWRAMDGSYPEKQGKNTFTVTDLNGNVAKYSFYIDRKAPVVKGVKNNKSYKKKAVLYVKDKCKLSKITINGKKKKMTDKQLVKKGKYKGYYKYTVKKKGTNRIVVKDKAGNKKTVKIRIR